MRDVSQESVGLASPEVGPALERSALTTDRLVYTAFLATLCHGILIMGVTFTADDAAEPFASKPLEVVIVPREAPDEEPDDARYIAQSSQRGAGNTADDVRAASELSEGSEVSNPGTDDSLLPFPTEPGELVEISELITTPTPSRAVHSPYDVSALPHEVAFQARLLRDTPASQVLIEAALAERIARSDNPRERFLSVNTKEAVFAAYLEAWKRRIEKFGTLNYPDEARRRGLRGSPILEVAVGQDGGLQEIVVIHSSGHKLLDQAALRILRLAAPFDPFPEEIRHEYDVLRFVYEWQFLAAGDSRRGTGTTAVRGKTGR